ncbi:MAG TPA: DUF465 domain-containing protein [Bryobacteraceae bacterium]|nr:DUF465 domain-containing protein [Bryobacteraceae bacterium]
MPSFITSRRDYPPSLVPEATDSARQPYWEELPHMERNAQEELKAHLMATNEEFQRLSSQHSEYAHKLDALEALPHLTLEEQIEETRLKKLKLRLKDQMGAIMSQSRSQQVA